MDRKTLDTQECNVRLLGGSWDLVATVTNEVTILVSTVDPINNYCKAVRLSPLILHVRLSSVQKPKIQREDFMSTILDWRTKGLSNLSKYVQGYNYLDGFLSTHKYSYPIKAL